MNKFVTGIDDISTMSARCAGWTIVSFENAALSEFDRQASEILASSGLSTIHAKDFKRRKSDYYKQYLNLVRKTLESNQGFVCCTLLGSDWKNQFKLFCNNVIGEAFNKAGIYDQDIIEGSKRIAAPLFTYQRIAASKCNGGLSTVQIDRDSVLDKLTNTGFLVRGKKISSQLPIVAALRANGRCQFPNAPEVERESILIVPDECSYIVQAADIIGNFSTALVFKYLGKSSKSNDSKCAVFQEVFGDIIDLSTIPSSVSMCGDDLELDPGAASFTFCIS